MTRLCWTIEHLRRPGGWALIDSRTSIIGCRDGVLSVEVVCEPVAWQQDRAGPGGDGGGLPLEVAA